MSDYKLAARVTRIERERESVCDRKDNKIRGERGRRIGEGWRCALPPSQER